MFSINKAKIEKWEKKKKINKLICALERTDNFDIRVEAAKALHRIGRGGVAITKLREGLFDDNENVRKEAAEALANISVHVLIEEGERCSLSWEVECREITIAEALAKVRDQSAIKPLIEALGHPRKSIRDAAASALVKIGEPALDPLITALRQRKKGPVHELAAEALAALNWKPKGTVTGARFYIANRQFEECAKLGPIAVKPLIEALGHKEESVRNAAAEALVKIGGSALKPLTTALGESNEVYSWQQAAKALAALNWKPEVTVAGAKFCIGNRQFEECVSLGAVAVDPLIQNLGHNEEIMRNAAAEALSEIGELSVKPLIQAYETGFLYTIYGEQEPLIRAPNTDWETILRTIRGTLAQIGKPAVEPLIEFLKKYPIPDHYDMFTALIKIGDGRAAHMVLNFLFKNPFESPKRPWLYPRLFIDYAAIILDLTSIGVQTYTKRDDVYHRYSVDTINTALARLSELKTPISNNLLHLVTQMEDIEVVVRSECEPSMSFLPLCVKDKLSFENQRRIATEELNERGNPPYEDSAYLNKNAWKL